MAEETSFKYIVRIAGVDIDGDLKLPYGLASIKGIGYTTAMAVIRMLGLDPEKKVGFLTEEEIRRLDEVLRDITQLGLPKWLYNRRRDYETGKDLHLIGNELIFYARRDIEREMKIGSWRGIRHKYGLKVRGQRTRTTGRLGMTIGVRKKR
ncbi:30S ribosomal protein S13 [Aeropyrum camini]|uniref:Small ribosomal subunit protein uS13 n=1 Tax=Aeropyrum camini SY1 = JCM 12091 TaxID=1198449 RepID=U3TEV0_9CREN|nr:30S ribosomal protein S13 [Aeropyrum camini]BAN90560.1 30S ribosomal protein S13 [Aeropyrum camini SY1 = JCM 12091]